MSGGDCSIWPLYVHFDSSPDSKLSEKCVVGVSAVVDDVVDVVVVVDVFVSVSATVVVTVSVTVMVIVSVTVVVIVTVGVVNVLVDDVFDVVSDFVPVLVLRPPLSGSRVYSAEEVMEAKEAIISNVSINVSISILFFMLALLGCRPRNSNRRERVSSSLHTIERLHGQF